jgi:hypothetical protein
VTVTSEGITMLKLKLVETFEVECTNPLEIQRDGNIQNAMCDCVMTISPEERESRLRKMRKDGKDTLLELYSAVFVQFMDEADALLSWGDHASAADVLMNATLYNKILTDIGGGESS